MMKHRMISVVLGVALTAALWMVAGCSQEPTTRFSYRVTNGQDQTIENLVVLVGDGGCEYGLLSANSSTDRTDWQDALPEKGSVMWMSGGKTYQEELTLKGALIPKDFRGTIEFTITPENTVKVTTKGE